MNEHKYEQSKVEITGWFAVADAEDVVQAIFPTENLAGWYLEKYGWSSWKIFEINDETES